MTNYDADPKTILLTMIRHSGLLGLGPPAPSPVVCLVEKVFSLHSINLNVSRFSPLS